MRKKSVYLRNRRRKTQSGIAREARAAVLREQHLTSIKNGWSWWARGPLHRRAAIQYGVRWRACWWSPRRHRQSGIAL